METYIVDVYIDDTPTYQLDVPTTFGEEGAETRAFWTIAAKHGQMDLTRIRAETIGKKE